MKTFFKIMAGVVLSAVYLAGCTPWTKQNCVNTNWFALGKQKGATGAAFDIDEAARHCKSYGVVVNRQTFHRGYIAGLHTFCTNKAALKFGQHGGHYLGQCQQLSWSRDQSFRRFWKQGLLSYCKPSVIRQLALQGKPFPSWCPEERHATLNVAYDKGNSLRHQHGLRQGHISYLNQQIAHLSAQINTLYRQGVAPTDPRVIELQRERTHLTDERYLLQEHQAGDASF